MTRIMALLVALGCMATTDAARPCSCLPGRGRWLTESGDVPREMRGAVWFGSVRQRSRPLDATGFIVERVVVTAEGEVSRVFEVNVEQLDDTHWLIAPKEAMRPGERWRFTHASPEPDAPAAVIELGVKDVALGGLREAPRVSVADQVLEPVVVAASASCSAVVPAVRRALAFELPAAARGMEGALLYYTEVDGKPWHPSGSLCSPVPEGRSWETLARDLVYGHCFPPAQGRPWVVRGNPGLKMGRHKVAMRAELPGTRLTLRAPTVTFELACPTAPE